MKRSGNMKIMRIFILMTFTVLTCCLCSEAQDGKSDTGAEITFVELGSERCIPCKMMQPVMDRIEKEYAGSVKVIFYDVWTDEGSPFGEKYGIRTIPTQIFLDKEGKEIFRHTGFFSFKDIAQVLEKHGVMK
ncbi:MAG: thioredoxin family protein [Candidatus Omnitrophota bacterium]